MSQVEIPLTTKRQAAGVPKSLPSWKIRLAKYVRDEIGMPMQWTTAHCADRRCACCGFILRDHGHQDPRGVPACRTCTDEVAMAIAAATVSN